MQMSHEALYASVYRSVFVQGRGGLRADLHRCLRTGRARRVPNARSRASSERARTRIPGLVSISERPAEVEDRALPGHWEGDLIIGKDGQSAVATLVERTTRYVMLLPLPRPADLDGDSDGYSGSTGRGAEAVRDAVITAIGALPKHLWQSLTWDRGIEMARHFQITAATDVAVYFCDPHSPWQRGSNENTNGLVRQYLPKGTDLAVHSARDLDVISIKLNGRPRQTLDWKTPAEALNELLSRPYDHDGVAGTA
jgi:IS30 family transposase